jgi:hypothetical protein
VRPLKRDIACGICGLFACVHLTVLGATEAAHPHEHPPRPVIEVAALPPEPDHTHRDFDHSIRFESIAAVVSGAPLQINVFDHISVNA